MDSKPFFMPVNKGGRGLVSLLDLQAAITCAATFHELNSNCLSHHTTTATWTHAYLIPNSSLSNWITKLSRVGLTAWPKIRDMDLIRHTTDSPHIARALVSWGITRWSQLTCNHKLLSKPLLEQAIGVPLTANSYLNI